MAAVDSGKSLPHGVNPVSKRKQGIEVLEKSRRHFNGVGSGRAGNLHNDQDDAQRFSDVLEGDGKGVYEVDIDKRSQHSRKEKGGR